MEVIHTLMRQTANGPEKHLIETRSDIVVRPNGKTVEQTLIEIASGAPTLPPGVVMMWGGPASTIPANWKLCNGETLNIINYPHLFSMIGNTYGGDGSKTFMLPDLRDRFIPGAGSSYAVGAKGGESTHTLTVDEIPAHVHRDKCSNTAYSATENVQDPANNIAGLGKAGSYAVNNYKPESFATGFMAPSESIGGGQPHENRPPYFALCYIIYMGI